MRVYGSVWLEYEKTFYGIYVCHDADPKLLRSTLSAHYSNTEKLKDLIKNGSALYIGPRTDCPPGHSHLSPAQDRCVFWKRDMGLQNVILKKTSILDVRSHTRFSYMFNGNEWFRGKLIKTEPLWINLSKDTTNE